MGVMRPDQLATCWSPSSSAFAWVWLAARGRTWEIGHGPTAERMASLYTTFSRGPELLKVVDGLWLVCSQRDGEGGRSLNSPVLMIYFYDARPTTIITSSLAIRQRSSKPLAVFL